MGWKALSNSNFIHKFVKRESPSSDLVMIHRQNCSFHHSVGQLWSLWQNRRHCIVCVWTMAIIIVIIAKLVDHPRVKCIEIVLIGMVL